MKFDLFDAMGIMVFNFGESSEITIGVIDLQYQITLIVRPNELVPFALKKNIEKYF